jgi:hypothetical protein
MPADQIDGMRQSPTWPVFEAIAPTLAYDHATILGNDAAVPRDLAARVTVPTLGMDATRRRRTPGPGAARPGRGSGPRAGRPAGQPRREREDV